MPVMAPLEPMKQEMSDQRRRDDHRGEHDHFMDAHPLF